MYAKSKAWMFAKCKMLAENNTVWKYFESQRIKKLPPVFQKAGEGLTLSCCGYTMEECFSLLQVMFLSDYLSG